MISVFLNINVEIFNPSLFSYIVKNFIGKYHVDPTNVLLHFVTTPIGYYLLILYNCHLDLGLIGALSLMRSATSSSSAALALTGF